MKYLQMGVVLAVLFWHYSAAFSQDSLQLSLWESERIFLEENLILMAERLNLDISDEKIKQAKLWNNPEIGIEHQIINRSGKGPLGFTDRDNTAFEIEQLFTTAGKRGHEIRLRELEKMNVEQQLDLLIRTFKRTLREEFFSLAFLNKMEGLYQEQIDALDRILKSFEEQQQEGNISRMEVIRIRSLLLELEREYSEILKEQIESQNALKILLQLQDQMPVPELPDDLAASIQQVMDLETAELYKRALESRPDLMSARTETETARQSLVLERANRYPDLGVGLVYDRLDGLVDNYFGISFSLEVPLWNRNRENIQKAQYQIQQSEFLFSQAQQGIFHEIEKSVKKYERAAHLLDRLDDTYEDDFAAIIEGLLHQYTEGDIRLIEFIDFYESFREGVIRNYQIREEYLKAAEELNYAIGRDIFQFNF
jgi:outer membrane protein, heavy metal efflux system